MKKNNHVLILAFVSFSFTCQLFSQNFYITPSFAHGFATQKMNIDYNYNIYYSQVTQTVDEQFKIIRTSFGAGNYYSGNIGYAITKNIAFEMGASYLKSNIIEATHTYKYYYGDDVFTYTYKTNSFRLIPCMSMSLTKEWEGLKPYFKIAMVLSKPIIYREAKYVSYANYRANIKHTDISKMSYGSMIGIGTTRRVAKNIFLVAEINISHLFAHFIESNTTSYIVNGADSLSTLSPYQRKTIYGDNYTNNYTSSSSTTAPRKEPMLILPFSSIDLNFGIKFTLPNIKHEKKDKRSKNSTSTSSSRHSDTSETIYNLVEIMPQFQDGTNTLLKFIKDNTQYPPKSLGEKISGTVFISLIIYKDGHIGSINVLKGINSELNEEAIRVIKLTEGKWKSGIHNGKNADVLINVPTKFLLP